MFSKRQEGKRICLKHMSMIERGKTTLPSYNHSDFIYNVTIVSTCFVHYVLQYVRYTEYPNMAIMCAVKLTFSAI